MIFFFFNDTATTEIYTLSLHDALPILHAECAGRLRLRPGRCAFGRPRAHGRRREPLRCELRLGLPLHPHAAARSEEHTSELQSQSNLVCRLLLEKKKKKL